MKSLAKKVLEHLDKINEKSSVNLYISAPKDTPKKAQTFIVYLYKDGSKKPYETFERFGCKRLSTVVKQMKWLLNQWPYKSDVEKKVYDRIKIFTSFNDNINNDSENPVLDMSLEEFFNL